MADLNQKTDDELLNELRVSDPHGSEVEHIRMTLFVSKINHLACVITQAGNAGRALSWAIGIATIVATVIAVLQFVRSCSS
jgi:hypothetical protein